MFLGSCASSVYWSACLADLDLYSLFLINLAINLCVLLYLFRFCVTQLKAAFNVLIDTFCYYVAFAAEQSCVLAARQRPPVWRRSILARVQCVCKDTCDILVVEGSLCKQPNYHWLC